MGDTQSVPHVQSDFSTPALAPTSRSRTSSTSSRKDEGVPTTPPPKSEERRYSPGAYRSPDAYTHTHTILPPMTPSSHQFDQSKSKLSNVPQTPFGAVTPGDDRSSPSPLKSPSQFKDTEEGEKPPIRQITSKLKTRLNYAFVKYSNGWTNQSLDELEKTVSVKEREEIEGKFGTTISPQRLGASPSRITKPSSIKSPVRPHRLSMDQQFDNAGGSAHAAFLAAMSKGKSPKKRVSPSPRLGNSPFRPPPLQLTTSSQQSSSQSGARSPEAEAIATLMSLSSPQGYKPKLKLSRHDLPRQKLSFGDKLPNETAIVTGSDTEYEETDDEKSPTHDRSMKVDDEDEDVQTASEDES